MQEQRYLTKTAKEAAMPSQTHQNNSHIGRYEQLMDAVTTKDTVCIPIVADPDAVASALALKRLFWRKVKNTIICRVNAIKRSDNLAMIRDLKITLPYIKQTKTSNVTKWALVDSQPHHHTLLGNIDFTIIIDHHPPGPLLNAAYIDIREEYGAVASMMTEYLKAASIKPSAELATALFYGIKSDTDNFARSSVDADIKAFRYLYPYANLNLIKKIESSEINEKNIADFRKAFEALTIVDGTAYVHMGDVDDADILVILADFFLKIAGITWCMISGIYGKKIVIIIRNAGFRLDAGKVAQRLFGKLGSAGGHKSAARAEVPLTVIETEAGGHEKIREHIIAKITKS